MFGYVAYSTVVLSVVLAVLYLIGFGKRAKSYQVFALYLLAIAIIQLSCEYMIKAGKGSNLFLFHYYFISQFVLLSLFYFYLLKRKWILWLLVVVLGFLTYQYIRNPELYFQYNASGSALTQIVLVVYAVIYLYHSLTQSSSFITVNIGLLVYLLSSIIIFSSGNFVFNLDIPAYVSKLLNDLNSILYLLLQIMIFIEWYRNYRPKNDSLSRNQNMVT